MTSRRSTASSSETQPDTKPTSKARTLSRRIAKTTYVIIPRSLSTIASLTLLSVSLHAFPTREAIVLQGALAATALAGLFADFGISLETTRSVVNGAGVQSISRYFRIRLQLLAVSLALILLLYLVTRSFRTLLIIALLAPLAISVQRRAHHIAILRSEHLAGPDLRVLPYVSATDLAAGAIAAQVSHSALITATTIGASSIMTTCIMVSYFKATNLYPPTFAAADTSINRSIFSIVKRGLVPALSGAGTRILLMTLAASATSKNIDSDLAFAATIGGRVIDAFYALAILVWVVPSHVSSSRAGNIQLSATPGATILFAIGTSTTAAYCWIVGGVDIAMMAAVATGVGLIGAGLFLQADSIHKLHGMGLRTPFLPVFLSLLAIAISPHLTLLLLPVAGLICIVSTCAYRLRLSRHLQELPLEEP